MDIFAVADIKRHMAFEIDEIARQETVFVCFMHKTPVGKGVAPERKSIDGINGETKPGTVDAARCAAAPTVGNAEIGKCVVAELFS